MMASGDMGHDVCDDVGDGDNGNNDAGNDTDEGDGGDAGGEGGGLLAEDAAAVAVAVGTAAVAAAAYCRGRRECNIPVQKKWAQRSGKEAIRVKENDTVLHFIIMAQSKIVTVQLTKTGTIVKGRMRSVMKSV
jgi:hypothetical protein